MRLMVIGETIIRANRIFGDGLNGGWLEADDRRDRDRRAERAIEAAVGMIR